MCLAGIVGVRGVGLLWRWVVVALWLSDALAQVFKSNERRASLVYGRYFAFDFDFWSVSVAGLLRATSND